MRHHRRESRVGWIHYRSQVQQIKPHLHLQGPDRGLPQFLHHDRRWHFLSLEQLQDTGKNWVVSLDTAKANGARLTEFLGPAVHIPVMAEQLAVDNPPLARLLD